MLLFLCYRATHSQGQSNTETHKHTHTHTNKPTDSLWIGDASRDAVCGSTKVDQWIGGSVVEINVSGSTGLVDQCLWKRSVLVEEINIFFSPIAFAFFSLSPFILLFPFDFFSQQNHKIIPTPASTTEFEKSIEEKEERIKRRRKKENETKKEGDGSEKKKESWREKRKEKGGWGHVGSCLFYIIKKGNANRYSYNNG